MLGCAKPMHLRDSMDALRLFSPLRLLSVRNDNSIGVAPMALVDCLGSQYEQAGSSVRRTFDSRFSFGKEEIHSSFWLISHIEVY